MYVLIVISGLYTFVETIEVNFPDADARFLILYLGWLLGFLTQDIEFVIIVWTRNNFIVTV
jgi:hypothetical protein